MGSWKEEVTMVHISQEHVEADMQCYICLDDLLAGEEVMKLSCSHHYHEMCISPWLDRNNICPTCRQKILSREDLDSEEHEFEFDAGFLTDIIREINNIVYGVDSDEEFLFSDSPSTVELNSIECEMVALEEYSVRNERNTGSQGVSEHIIDDELPHTQELEGKTLNQNEQSVLSEVSSGEETQNHQSLMKSVKRRRSVEVEDSSDDEDGSSSNTVSLLQDMTRSQQNTLYSQNAQPIREFIPYSVNRSNVVGSRKKLRKRQRRSFELEECQDSSDEDFECHTTYESSEINNKKNVEIKQMVKGKEDSEEPKRGKGNRSAQESPHEESDDGVFVFDMVEVENLVSKLLEIMNQGEDESNPTEDEKTDQSSPEEWSIMNILNQESKGNIKKNEKSVDEYDEIYKFEDSNVCLSNKNKTLSKSVVRISKEGMNIVPNNRQVVERNQNPCHRKEVTGKPVKRKVSSPESESCEDNKKSLVKRKVVKSCSNSSEDDECDGFGNIEQIISELWSIVAEDSGESDQNQLDVEKIHNTKTEPISLQKKESPKKHKRNHF